MHEVEAGYPVFEQGFTKRWEAITEEKICLGANAKKVTSVTCYPRQKAQFQAGELRNTGKMLANVMSVFFRHSMQKFQEGTMPVSFLAFYTR